jgi:pyrrolidone-carboxylate peptidase
VVEPSILLTGFTPFANYAINSSEQVVRELAGKLAGERVRCEILPVDHHAAHHRMRELLAEVRPDVCLATGMWQGAAFRIERVGRRCPGLAQVDGDEELFGEWDWPGMSAALERSGRPVVFSDDAGKYVCDTTYWSLLEHRSRHAWPKQAAFLHLPAISGEWTVELMSAGVASVLASLGVIR